MDETKTYEEPKPAAEAEEAPAAAEAVPSEGKPEKARKAKREKPEKDDARLKELREKLEKTEQELGETKDQYQRMLAEYANYKRRTEQEKEQLGQFSRGEMLCSLQLTIWNGQQLRLTEKSTKRAWIWLSASSMRNWPAWGSRRSRRRASPSTRNCITRSCGRMPTASSPTRSRRYSKKDIAIKGGCCVPPWSKWPTSLSRPI